MISSEDGLRVFTHMTRQGYRPAPPLNMAKLYRSQTLLLLERLEQMDIG
ncbi:Rop family plasmid primer RNA-binding protein [Enterobacter hormaechei]